MNRTRRTAPASLVIAAVAVTALSACSDSSGAAEPTDSPSQEASSTTLTYRLVEAGGEFDAIDVGEKGESAGDRHVGAMTLRSDGQDAGRLHTDCLVLDNAYEGQMCSLVAMLPGGTIAFQSAGLHKPLGDAATDGETFAVTGGTGDYVGAQGEMTSGAGGATLTITLER